MKIYSKVVWDIETLQVIESESYEYDGVVAECKGSDEANNQRKEQIQMQKDQLAKQNATLDQIKGGVGKYLTGNEGFNDQMMAQLQSQFLNNNALDYANAGSAVRDALAAKGQGNGDLPVGGTYTRGLSSLLGSQAAQHGAGILNLGIANQQQALANKFNAASVLNGSAATLGNNVGVFGSGASAALGDYIRAANSGFGASFMQNLGGTLGKGIGSAAVGGVGTFASTLGNGNYGW